VCVCVCVYVCVCVCVCVCVWSGCTELFCPNGDTSFNALWPDNTAAGATGVLGVCRGGFIGAPVRNCQLDGTWAGTATGTACVRTCAGGRRMYGGIYCKGRSWIGLDWVVVVCVCVCVCVCFN
jgi:hypothetical protein